MTASSSRRSRRASSRSSRPASSISAAPTTTTCAAAVSRSTCSEPRANSVMGGRDTKVPPVPDPAAVVADLSRAHIAARCLHVIAECGAADAVGDAGASPAEIATHTGLDADALDRMLRLLAAHGIFVRTADGRYAHSAASRLLKTEEPGSLRAYVRMG